MNALACTSNCGVVFPIASAGHNGKIIAFSTMSHGTPSNAHYCNCSVGVHCRKVRKRCQLAISASRVIG